MLVATSRRARLLVQDSRSAKARNETAALRFATGMDPAEVFHDAHPEKSLADRSKSNPF